ncbi:MAG: DUF4330 family protein [Clostridia bacterium]|nr:DUF4330 family protein [Clostridia bacterium]
MNKTKIRFAAFDVVVLIVVAALALTLIFRFTTNMKLYTYNTEKYTVTVRAEGLQYTTIDMISLSDSVYFENGKYLGQIVSSPTVTPKMVYELGASGDFIPAYYPDNTLVDMTTSLECDLTISDGMLVTQNGVHIAVGSVLKLHTQTVDITVEIVAIEKIEQ